MDIHKPKHPIDSVRAFLLKIFTVTVGILIALELEAAIEAHHADRLGAQVRADFVAELRQNQASNAERIAAEAGDEAMLMQLLQYGMARSAHAPATPPDLAGIHRSFTTLSQTAWDTALATQGIAQLTHAQVRALAAVYNTQRSYNALEQQGLSEWVSLAAYGDLASLGDADVVAGTRILRVCYAMTASAATLQTRLAGEYAAALNSLGQS